MLTDLTATTEKLVSEKRSGYTSVKVIGAGDFDPLAGLPGMGSFGKKKKRLLKKISKR